MNDHNDLPRHSIQSIAMSLAAIDLTLEHMLRRLAAIEKQMTGGATADELDLILKELAENKAKLKAAGTPPVA